MASLASIEKQIQALQKQADSLRQSEKATAIKTVRGLVVEFGLTAEDVGLAMGGKRGRAKVAVAPKTGGVAKYRDPVSGKTWTGHGKPPGWIAGAADRSKFLIEAQAVAGAGTEPKAKRAAKKAVAKKVSAKAAAAPEQAVKAPAAKKQPRAAKVAAAPVKKASAARKAAKPAAKKAAAAPKSVESGAGVAAPAEAA